MKLTPFLLVSAFLASSAFANDPEPVKVYCFSEELEAGFKDLDGNFFCHQLGKRGEKKKSLSRVDSRESADVVAEFLSAEVVTKRGETTYLNYGLAWTPDERTNVETAVVNVGDFAKGFQAEGINASAGMQLVKKVEEWIRENRNTILEKSRK